MPAPTDLEVPARTQRSLPRISNGERRGTLRMQGHVDRQNPARSKASPKRAEAREDVHLFDQVPQTVHWHHRQLDSPGEPKAPKVTEQPMPRRNSSPAQFARPRDGEGRPVHSVNLEPPGGPEASEGTSSAGELRRGPRRLSHPGGGHTQIRACFLGTIPRERGVVNVRVARKVERPGRPWRARGGCHVSALWFGQGWHRPSAPNKSAGGGIRYPLAPKKFEEGIGGGQLRHFPRIG